MRGQLIIFIILFLLLVGILAGGMARMWQSGTQVSSSGELSMQALYLAQAGIERGKIEVLYGYWNEGSHPPIKGDLDIPGVNYQFRYEIDIFTHSPPDDDKRTIKAKGIIFDLANKEIARREIEVKVEGIQDSVDNVTGSPPRDNIDDDLTGTVTGWSWRGVNANFS